MHRKSKEATVKRCHCGLHQQLKEHPPARMMAYSLARGLKTLKGLTPDE